MDSYYGMDGGSFSVHEVDETSSVTDMMGASSATNQARAWTQSPSRALVLLWLFVLALYWFLGYFFKGARK